jgi:hypothetical protein
VALASDHESFDAFKDAIRALPLETRIEDGMPMAKFTTMGGDEFAFTYNGVPTVNGTAIDYAGWPLYGGPFVNAGVNSRELVLTYKEERRRLDFAKLTIE